MTTHILRLPQSALPVHRCCELVDLPRSSFYRHLQPVPERSRARQALIELLHRLCIDDPDYGYRRICVEVRKHTDLDGIPYVINGKAILRLMRQQGILCVPRRRYIHTTDSNHSFRVFENLIKHITLTDINQLWVSDITYIAYKATFAYLAVILDALSRRVVGWKISKHIDTSLTLGALRMALETRSVSSRLIHHSDRGVQYASKDYVQELTAHGISISMSAPGNPYENAKAESFMKTIKKEEVYRNNYQTFDEVVESITRYINRYNTKRIHSSIGYMAPAEFEMTLMKSQNHQHPGSKSFFCVSI